MRKTRIKKLVKQEWMENKLRKTTLQQISYLLKSYYKNNEEGC